MGWLFGKKKKVPKVPLPAGKPFDENSLQFPEKISTDKMIKPTDIKSAVGFDKPVNSLEEIKPQEVGKKINPLQPLGKKMPDKSNLTPEPVQKPQMPGTNIKQGNNGELFVKVEVYQRILGELDLLKEEMTKVSSAQKQIETSEFNEERNFEKLKRSMRTMHDNVLQIDKTLFKT